MGNQQVQVPVRGVLQLGLGILSLFGVGMPRDYIGGVTAIANSLELFFAEPHEVGTVAVLPAAPAVTPQAAS